MLSGYLLFMPNRVLRDWTTSEAIDTLSVHAEVFFTRLIMKADDYGNYTANPKLLKAALFPLRDVSAHEIDNWITECITCGIIKKYSVEGKDYLNIPNFGQRLRAMKSHYPDLSQSSGSHTTVNSRLETKRKEVETNLNGQNSDWEIWGDQIVNQSDPVWEPKGRKVSRQEMDIFLSVATRCGWKMATQQEFRTSLKGFKAKDAKTELVPVYTKPRSFGEGQ